MLIVGVLQSRSRIVAHVLYVALLALLSAENNMFVLLFADCMQQRQKLFSI